jgi:hypothetical protein
MCVPHRVQYNWPARLAVIALLLGSMAGCEEDVNPFIGTDLPFSVYGFINPKADTHAVRVFTIDDQLRLITPGPIDADVSMLRRSDGARFTWRDSVIQLFNGDYRHVYWLSAPIDFGETYRLEIIRSDGVLTNSTDVVVPQPIAIEIVPPDENAVSTIELPIDLVGDPPALPRIDLIYTTFSTNTAGVVLAELPVPVSYTGKQLRREDRWSLTIDLREDFRFIARTYAELELPGTLLCAKQLRLEVHVGNAEWVSPIGVFDENVLVEPGTFDNIENGFGFFGAGYVDSVSWRPPDQLLLRAGFDDCTAQDR